MFEKPTVMPAQNKAYPEKYAPLDHSPAIGVTSASFDVKMIAMITP
jgi:hypothetical protein